MRFAGAWAFRGILLVLLVLLGTGVGLGCSLNRGNHITGGDEDGGSACGFCDDGIDCTADVCSESGTCENLPDPARCTAEPGGRCDVARGCVYESCSMDNCFPGPCQVNRCEGSRCVLESACADDEFCCAGRCEPLGCNDNNPCTVDRCGATGCEHDAATGIVDCFDGTFCTGPDTCVGTACVGTDQFCPMQCDEGRDRCVGCIVDATGAVQGCPPGLAGPWTSCGGFDAGNICDETGTRSRIHTTYSCVNDECVPAETTEVEDCRVDRSGVQCGNTVCDPWSSCIYSSTCDESGDRTRACRDRLCNGGSCTTSTRQETRSSDSFCDRDTDAIDCGSRTCDGNTSNWTCPYPTQCSESVAGTQPCTDRRCQTGSCRNFPASQGVTCTRNTSGDSCGPGVDCSGIQCTDGFSDVCDESGTRQCNDNRCASGSCQIVGTVTRNCTRDTDGDGCDDGVSCTTPDLCSNGSCSGTRVDANCDNGMFCDGAETCGGSGCVSGSDPCPSSMCDESTDACVQCSSDGDCSGTPATPLCASGTCVECKNNPDCPAGMNCTGNVCM